MGLGPFGPLSGIECSLYLGPSAPFGLVMGPSGLYEPLANDACLPMVMLKWRQLSSKQAKHASSESSQTGKEDPHHNPSGGWGPNLPPTKAGSGRPQSRGALPPPPSRLSFEACSSCDQGLHGRTGSA